MARMDGGDVPEKNSLGDLLPMPTAVESCILSRCKPMQQLYVLQFGNRPPHLRPRGIRAHGIVFANPEPDVLRAALPMRAHELPNFISVVQIDAVSVENGPQEMAERMQHAKALQVSACTIVCVHQRCESMRKLQPRGPGVQRYCG